MATSSAHLDPQYLYERSQALAILGYDSNKYCLGLTAEWGYCEDYPWNYGPVKVTCHSLLLAEATLFVPAPQVEDVFDEDIPF